MTGISPFAPSCFPDLPEISGACFATIACGIKYKGRNDLLLMEFVPSTQVAGVFTRSKTAAAPIYWCRNALDQGGGHGRVLVVNAGIANAFTGRLGVESVTDIAQAVVDLTGCSLNEVFLASTGVISEILPYQKIINNLNSLYKRLSSNWEMAARAIMTTDTFPKGAMRTCTIADKTVKLVGIAKGSGMIAPNMATTLCFVVTDANIPAVVLQKMLKSSVKKTFNCVTVDSDTSTNDTILVFATGRAHNSLVSRYNDPALYDFGKALDDLLRDLALQVVKDGEGLSKFITIDVSGATDEGAARKIGLSIANSPLVKTAIAGEDANWGRIVMAVGKAGEEIDCSKLSILIGGTPIADLGCALPDYDEAPIVKYMKGREIHLEIDVGVGNGKATVWTCDLTHKYITINADYRS